MAELYSQFHITSEQTAVGRDRFSVLRFQATTIELPIKLFHGGEGSFHQSQRSCNMGGGRVRWLKFLLRGFPKPNAARETVPNLKG